jgi:hypothetical protein
MTTRIAVHIEAYQFASEAEIRQVFERYGFRATVTPNIHFGPPPPGAPDDYLVITVAVAALATFLRGFLDEAGKDAWRSLKSLIRDLGAARRRGPGRFVIHDHVRHIEVLVPSDLPDDGFVALFEQDPATLPDRSVVEYSSRLKRWVVTGTLAPGRPGTPMMIFHTTFKATIGSLSVPSTEETDAVDDDSEE